MTKHLRKLGEYAKFGAAAIGGTVTVVLGVSEIMPDGAVKNWITGAAATATAIAVLLLRNQRALDAAGDLGADLLER
ncbi:hypothetical protein [Nocardia wallacei]|uniref:hypothetical protein n=1 Tax=Nocardia wallacei TaxID=480035 RepID=UPI002455BD3B|nr:hypothetical protein [Nocardia wallacei]